MPRDHATILPLPPFQHFCLMTTIPKSQWPVQPRSFQATWVVDHCGCRPNYPVTTSALVHGMHGLNAMHRGKLCAPNVHIDPSKLHAMQHSVHAWVNLMQCSLYMHGLNAMHTRSNECTQHPSSNFWLHLGHALQTLDPTQHFVFLLAHNNDNMHLLACLNMGIEVT